jgi:fucose permease
MRTTLYPRSSAGNLAVLHPAFALTGICHSMCGPLLPALASTFHLNDRQTGVLLALYFAGTSAGALLCGRRHSRTLVVGFLALAVAAFGVSASGRYYIYPGLFMFGVGVGLPMTAVSMYAGQTFADRSAAPLTLLNFSWSGGALLAPVVAAQLMLHHTFRIAYVVLGCAALLSAAACWSRLEEVRDSAPLVHSPSRTSEIRLIVMFAMLAFIEVGVENTSAAWLATYAHRVLHLGVSRAAAVSALYWGGFLAARGAAAFLLLRMNPARLLWITSGAGILAGAGLLFLQGTATRLIAMVGLGAALAPIFPLLLARFFAHAKRSSDSRWVLAVCGFGGSVIPGLAGWLSAATGSLRFGLIVIPAGLAIILGTLPLLPLNRILGPPSTGEGHA